MPHSRCRCIFTYSLYGSTPATFRDIRSDFGAAEELAAPSYLKS